MRLLTGRSAARAEPMSSEHRPHSSLQDALARAVAGRPWWRRLLPAPLQRHALPATVLGSVLVVSMLAVAAPWHSPKTSAPPESSHLGAAPAISHPPAPPHERRFSGRAEPRPARPAPEHPGNGALWCQRPLTVVAAPDIADLVWELAGPLTQGRCPEVSVRGESDDSARAGLATAQDRPDVWIPASSLWLRLAAGDHGDAFGAAGTSLARTPVVLAFPEPVYDTVAGQGTWPVWVMVYQQVTDGGIARMSMPDPDTTTGALALLAFHHAIARYSGHDEGGTFLRTIHFRDHLAATDAEAAVLLELLLTSSPDAAVDRVGVFPATEQQLLASRDLSPSVPVVAVGMHDALTEADFPFAVSGSLDDRLVDIADDLRQRLRSPAAVQRLVEAGFRPPHGDAGAPDRRTDLDRFPQYPDPVPLPQPHEWREIAAGWRWTG